MRTDDDFYETFGEPRVNEKDDTVLFETYGEDFEFVRSVDPNLVWTVMQADDDDSLILVPGLHFVNRINYVIAGRPRTEDENNDPTWQEVLWVESMDRDFDGDGEDEDDLPTP